jgi:hypothetical protein
MARRLRVSKMPVMPHMDAAAREDGWVLQPVLPAHVIQREAFLRLPR